MAYGNSCEVWSHSRFLKDLQRLSGNESLDLDHFGVLLHEVSAAQGGGVVYHAQDCLSSHRGTEVNLPLSALLANDGLGECVPEAEVTSAGVPLRLYLDDFVKMTEASLEFTDKNFQAQASLQDKLDFYLAAKSFFARLGPENPEQDSGLRAEETLSSWRSQIRTCAASQPILVETLFRYLVKESTVPAILHNPKGDSANASYKALERLKIEQQERLEDALLGLEGYFIFPRGILSPMEGPWKEKLARYADLLWAQQSDNVLMIPALFYELMFSERPVNGGLYIKEPLSAKALETLNVLTPAEFSYSFKSSEARVQKIKEFVATAEALEAQD